MTTFAVPREWWTTGEQAVATALGRLVEADYAGPSRLPGWDRAHLLGHLAGNADALVNLLTWARTGVETPMYASQEARDADIDRRAALSPAALDAEVLAATRRLADAVAAMPEEAWSAQVRTRQGRAIEAGDVIWMRAQEAWVHAVDLDAGVGFDDVPAEVLVAIVDRVFAGWERAGTDPGVTLFAGNREWGAGGVAVSGSVPAVAGWVLGRSAGEGLRSDGPLPELPPWM
ncbi:maleylpyruvate isomerase family mycothiol-dependent enzyme [Trujillonella endophytica]|uniref:Maleylpyruvate isomerase n=1 Tax=Trujillonella endophytica TaxID=673521 RepID=A0A1H8PUV3_9ACTN|nr:maleylpyruvate isomerase family mycothiol-dependent enzyme [Trujillella endophytica]SEO45769.1 maleylpyruvate isomerase [Trujillella endophytica]